MPGLSLERMTMLGGILLLGLAFFIFTVGIWRNTRWAVRLSQGWHHQLHQPRMWGLWVLSGLLLLISGGFFILITPEITEPFAAAIFVRLRPLARLVAGLAAQTLIALPLIRFGAGWRHTLRQNTELSRVVLLYGLFLLLAGSVQAYLSHTGPDPVGWNTLGTPLLDTQVVFVFLMGMMLVGLSGMVGKRSSSNPPRWKFDLLIGALLWLVAAWYWHSLPLMNNWYISAPRYPAFSFYPNSDGVAYDTTAQSLLAGMGYQTSHFPYPRRPLYDLFLFGLYLIKGQDFEAVVSLQAMIFAIFPALVYGVTKNLHSRLAGIIAGVLVLLREGNAMALTNVITVSHSKMAMSDFPTAIGVVLFAWVVLRWLNAPKRLELILMAGGILAAWMQIRFEVGVFIPVVFGLALVHLPRLKTRYLTSGLAFVGCMALVLSPWIVRNWRLTGQFFLETPDNRIGFLSGRLLQTSDDEIPQTPNEEGGKIITPRQKTRPAVLLEPLPMPAPSGFLQTLARHGLHSLSQAVLIFPDTYRLFDSTIGLLGHKNPDTFWTQCCSGKDYVKRLPFWEWGKWSGAIPSQAVIPILVNLLILTLGFRQTWKQHRWNSLLPVGLALGYYFANGVARTSGGRYILPVDWIWIGYYSVGLAHLIASVFHLFGKTPSSFLLPEKAPSLPVAETTHFARKTCLVLSLGFFLLGVSIPAAEAVFPPRYTDESLATWLSAFVEADETQQIAPHLHEFFTQGGAVLQGAGHYLRYYGAEQGEPGSLYPAVYPRPYPRLNIFLVGPIGMGVSLPVQGKPDILAENAADVLVFGCVVTVEKGPYFDALAMFYPSTGEIFVRSPFPETFTCPLPEP